MEWLKSLFPNLRDAAIRWSEDDASSMAASVAYYLALSLFPMVLLLTSGLGMFLQFTRLGQDAEQQLLATVSVNASPSVEQQFRDILTQMRGHSVITGPSGLIAAILAAIGVFAQLDRGFDKIWHIPARKAGSVRGTVVRVVRDRFWAFVMLVGLGGMIALLFVANMLLAHFRSVAGATLPSLGHVLRIFDLAATLVANAFLFAMAYRMLPKKKVGWIEAFRGGLLAAGIWELGCVVLGMFLIGMRYTMAYGVLGSFIAILLWCYYGVSIFFFGAEYVQVLQHRGEQRRKAIEASHEEKDVPSTPSTMLATIPLAAGVEARQRHRPRRCQSQPAA